MDDGGAEAEPRRTGERFSARVSPWNRAACRYSVLAVTTTETATRSAERPPTRAGTLRRADWGLAGVGVALGIAAMAVDHLLGDDPGLEDPPTFAISTTAILVIAAFLFGWAVPRLIHARRGSLLIALAAVVSLPLLWVGVPFVVAPAAIAVGLRGAGRSAVAAVAIGLVVLCLVTGAYAYSAVDKLS